MSGQDPIMPSPMCEIALRINLSVGNGQNEASRESHRELNSASIKPDSNSFV